MLSSISAPTIRARGWARLLSYLTIGHWCLAALGATVKINDLVPQLSGSSQALALARNPGVTDITAGWPKEVYASPDQAHLLGYWGALGVFCMLFIVATYFALKRADHGAAMRAPEGLSRRMWLLLLVPPVLLCALMAILSAI